jgi:apolipoprotein N-acyltransferase
MSRNTDIMDYQRLPHLSVSRAVELGKALVSAVPTGAPAVVTNPASALDQVTT